MIRAWTWRPEAGGKLSPRPEGISIAATGMPEALTAAMAEANNPERRGSDRPVPKMASTRNVSLASQAARIFFSGPALSMVSTAQPRPRMSS